MLWWVIWIVTTNAITVWQCQKLWEKILVRRYMWDQFDSQIRAVLDGFYIYCFFCKILFVQIMCGVFFPLCFLRGWEMSCSIEKLNFEFLLHVLKFVFKIISFSLPKNHITILKNIFEMSRFYESMKNLS